MTKGTVKALAKESRDVKGSTVYGVCVEVDGKEAWFDFWDAAPQKNEVVEFDFTQSNPKYNGNVSTFTVVDKVESAPATAPAPAAKPAAKATGKSFTPGNDRQDSIVRQSSVRDTLGVYAAAGLIYQGMSREELKARIFEAVEDSEILFLHGTCQDEALTELRG